MTTLKNYTLITGATSGIGYELAKLFAQNNHHLVIVSRSETDLQRVAKEFRQLGVDVIAISKDLFLKNAAFDLYNEVQDLGIEVDILVNNAAQGEYGKFIDTDLEKELEIVQLNIGAVITLSKLFLKDMVKRRNGKILNLSSIASKVPGPYNAVYHGTKAFIHSFSEAIRNELKDSGVTVTSLLPGPTDTDFFHKADMESSKIVQEGKLADPAEVAKDGYEALMKGKDMVISGFKNKVQATMSRVLSDSKSAESMAKQQKPVPKDKGHKK